MWYCLIGNVFLCIFKGIVGVLSGSLAVVADAVHSAADVLVSIVAVFAAYFGRRPPDKTHNYGHGKVEFIAGVFVGIVLLTGGALVIVSALNHLFSDAPRQRPHAIAVAAAVISIIVNEVLFRQAICAARHVNSAAIEAEAWDNRSDSFSSIPVLIGVIGAQFGFLSLDPLAALLVGVLVGKIGIQLFHNNLQGLMDAPLKSGQIKRIRELVVTVPGVKGIDWLRTRGMGRTYLAELQILVDPRTSVAKSNSIAHEIRTTLQREIDHLQDITIACKSHKKPQVAEKT
jgi:cation diffusion facilitator family transporter